MSNLEQNSIQIEINEIQEQVNILLDKKYKLVEKLDEINLAPKEYVGKYYKDSIDNEATYYFIASFSENMFMNYELVTYSKDYTACRTSAEFASYMIENIKKGELVEITKEEYVAVYNSIIDDFNKVLK